jgi:uncharacterized repeat protein (TIGR03806 family)
MARFSISPFLVLVFIASPTRADQLTHRWSFGESGSASHGRVLNDSVAGAPAVIRGSGATLDGSTLTLPGSSTGNASPAAISAYLDLPNGIVSVHTDLTLEIWATVRSAQSWQRLFDFGRMNLPGSGEITGTESTAPGTTQARDSFMLALARDGSLSNQRFSARIDGGTEFLTDASAAIAPNVRYHFVVTYQSGGGSFPAGGKISWFRNGTQIGSTDVPFRLTDLNDVNNWLGRSQWSGDRNANISYDEVRLYDYSLQPAQIAANAGAGPDSFPAPIAEPDTITLHRGQKAKIDVLANDSHAQTLEIGQAPQFGTVMPTADRQLLYSHTHGTPTSDSFSYSIANASGQSTSTTVTLQFAETLRLANPNLKVPLTPPPSHFTVVDALPGIAFNSPVCLRSPVGDSRRLFVCEKGGLLRVVADSSALSPTVSTFFNLPAHLTSRGESLNTGSESGLLSVAFHPDYASNRQFYLFYSVNAGGLRQRVSRFTADADNPNAADPSSEQILIDQVDQAGNHNGGDLHFGPDGYLYISVGDEGDGNDSLNNSQTITRDLFSGILRIDVDRKLGNIAPSPHPAIPLDAGVARFSIPKDNPFVLPADGGTWDGRYNGSAIANLAAVRREFYATGLRNPWRISFDGEDLWCGDVGQGAREEVNLITRGGNYGWAYREGNLNGPKSATAPANFNSLYHSPPLYAYDRNAVGFNGYSITGGLVYRGSRIPSLHGKYIFGDYGSGNIWALQRRAGSPPLVERLTAEGGIVAFGSDPANQDILLADIDGNRILRLISSSAGGHFPATLSATGLFADLTDLSPSAAVLPYEVNLPFWSDYAEKKRWFSVPDGISFFNWQREGPWGLPTGTLWVKHFEMVLNRNPPAAEVPIRKRIETRLLVKTPSGVYGASYRWNDSDTEATLADDGGEQLTLQVTDGGAHRPQTWRIPSRSECLSCHTPEGGFALSFNTRQLNLTQPIMGFPGNQLDILRQQGFFISPGPDSPHVLPRHVGPEESAYSMEARVRSYLAVNCSYCHQAGGSAPSQWDGRAELRLAETGLLHGPAIHNGGDPANQLVVPGDPEHSVVLQRVSGTQGFSRMPPLGSTEIDHANVALLSQWIAGDLASRQDYAAWRQQHFGSPTSQTGSPTGDPDDDGATNHAEFLAGTSPLDGASRLRPILTPTAAGLTLGFQLPNNRSYSISTSTNLRDWTPWDIPGNQGLPVVGGLIEIASPRDNARQFFRIQLREN